MSCDMLRNITIKAYLSLIDVNVSEQNAKRVLFIQAVYEVCFLAKIAEIFQMKEHIPKRFTSKQ